MGIRIENLGKKNHPSGSAMLYVTPSKIPQDWLNDCTPTCTETSGKTLPSLEIILSQQME